MKTKLNKLIEEVKERIDEELRWKEFSSFGELSQIENRIELYKRLLQSLEEVIKD